jgi:NTE family protein
VVFVADDGPSAWTHRCLRQCDEMLLVADADEPEALHPIEVECLARSSNAASEISKTLVLLHPESRRSPTGTRRWLDLRRPIRHLHLRPSRETDWQRLGRIVSGNAVGLVLSGGGARGFAHLGIFKALEEAGIDFDLIGGTSIGSVMAALGAMDMTAAEAVAHARKAFRENPTGDFNIIPLLSLFAGRRLKSILNQAILKSCGHDIDIEDLWKGFFCVSSNYSTSRESVRTSGNLARSIRASVAIPGALPPVMLDGELHIDGGAFNNFPTDIMSDMGAARIIGINLLRDRGFKYEIEDVPGPMALLFDKLRGRRNKLPSLPSLLMNSSMIYSFARQKYSQDFVDLYFSPSVHHFGMLDWSAFDRIVEAGYRYGCEELSKTDPSLIFPHLAPVTPVPGDGGDSPAAFPGKPQLASGFRSG